MKFKKSILVAALLVGITPLSFGQNWVPGAIGGTVHDFSTAGWNLSKEICNICHAPHNTAGGSTPLWAHTTAANTGYTMYGSTNSYKLYATMGTAPDGSSLLCLSCHDGTVAINSVNGTVLDTVGNLFGQIKFGQIQQKTGTIFHQNTTIGKNLTATHPISFTYDAALAATDPGLNDPTTTMIDGKTLQQQLLDGQSKVQCTSCHDPHISETTNWKYVRSINGVYSNQGSALCFACHNK